jgi:hypothetical protein
MLTLWSISKAVDCLWKQLRVDASLGDKMKGESDEMKLMLCCDVTTCILLVQVIDGVS